MDVPLKKCQSTPTKAQSEKQQKKETKANSQSESPKKRKGVKIQILVQGNSIWL